MTPAIYFYGLVALIGLIIALFGARNIAKAKAAQAWPSVVGTIERSQLRVTGIRPKYKPLITYRYTVEGTDHTGDLICYGLAHFSGTRSFADQFLTKYPAGQTVNVFYNPFSPAQCVLDPAVSLHTFIPVPGGLLLIVASICFGAAAMKQEPANPKRAKRPHPAHHSTATPSRQPVNTKPEPQPAKASAN